jgi:hypothetical protein
MTRTTRTLIQGQLWARCKLPGSDGGKERFGNGSEHGSGQDQGCSDRGFGGFGAFPEGSTHTESPGDQSQAELP